MLVMMKKIEEKLSRFSQRPLAGWLLAGLVIVVFFPLLLKMSLFRFFNQDELEHVHSAWHILVGHLPYKDFFQHHNFLMWYCMTPFLALVGETANIMIVMRMVMLVNLAVILLFATKLSYSLSGSKSAAMMTAVFLVSVNVFQESAMEIRPDGPQVLFCLLSIIAWIRFWQNRKNMTLAFSGLFAGVSFLFLQKSIFILPVFGIFFIVSYWKKEITLKQMMIFACTCAIPVLLSLAIFIKQDILRDYITTNFSLNIHHLNRFSFLHIIQPDLFRNSVFWLLSLPVLLYALFFKVRKEIRMVGMFAIFQIFMTMYAPHPYRQYFMLFIILDCIVLGYVIEQIMQRLKVMILARIVIGAMVIGYNIFAFTDIWLQENHEKLSAIQFVLDHTDPEDALYDGDMKFNLFRNDLHYFWFNVGPNQGLKTYQLLTGKYLDYDIHELIKHERPKFINRFRVRLEKNGLQTEYISSGLDDIYMRADLGIIPYPSRKLTHQTNRRLTRNIIDRYLLWSNGSE